MDILKKYDLKKYDLKKCALITGITGQDGSYLAEFLIEKDYIVYGIVRRSSSFNTSRIDHIFNHKQLKLRHGDVTDQTCLIQILNEMKAENSSQYEIYNLAGQSHVLVSFEMPQYTAQVNAMGTLNLLESLRIVNLPNMRFYQASTSELFGLVQEVPQKETTPFYPRSPYGIAKLYSYWITKNYRESYGMFCCNGILNNHESPRRGETFVTRKITIGISNILKGKQSHITLGNLNAKRDWSHAKDFVRAMWIILNADKPDDYVVASEKQYSVRDFVEKAFMNVGKNIKWSGTDENEVGIDSENGQILIKVDKKYFRPAEVESLVGDASKIKRELGWKCEISFDELVKEMVNCDL